MRISPPISTAEEASLARTGKMERRKTPRTSVGKLAYVNFEPYNTGGVITEISASGLRFHTVAPLQQGGVLRLSLVLAGVNPLEAVGEVVWTDSTRKIGGVRFVVLPRAAANQIENWLEDSASANSSQTGARSKTFPVTEPRASIPIASFVQPERIGAAASPAGPELSDAPIGRALAPGGWVLPGKPSTVLPTTYFDLEPQRRRSPFVRRLAVIFCLILAPVVWFGLRRYNWLNSWIAHVNPDVSNPVAEATTPSPTSGVLPGLDVLNSGKTAMVGNPAEAALPDTANPVPPSEQAQPAVPNPNSQAANPKTTGVTESPETSGAETTLAPKAEAAVPSGIETAQSSSERKAPLATAPLDSVVPASQHLAQIPAASALQPADNPGESELILAWQYLEGQGGRPRDPVAASRLLWTAVRKGNMTAETTLANLYLRGEGVPKSCDQARVLLSAASDKGSVEAKQKLGELNKTGCR